MYATLRVRDGRARVGVRVEIPIVREVPEGDLVRLQIGGHDRRREGCHEVDHRAKRLLGYDPSQISKLVESINWRARSINWSIIDKLASQID